VAANTPKLTTRSASTPRVDAATTANSPMNPSSDAASRSDGARSVAARLSRLLKKPLRQRR
jgi:hypothetical protein